MQKIDKEKSRKKLERLAWYLDSLIKVPGFNARFGLDGLIGLIPGFGDTIGALISSVVISEAARLGAPKVLLLKMALNIALDSLQKTFSAGIRHQNRLIHCFSKEKKYQKRSEQIPSIRIWYFSDFVQGICPGPVQPAGICLNPVYPVIHCTGHGHGIRHCQGVWFPKIS